MRWWFDDVERRLIITFDHLLSNKKLHFTDVASRLIGGVDCPHKKCIFTIDIRDQPRLSINKQSGVLRIYQAKKKGHCNANKR